MSGDGCFNCMAEFGFTCKNSDKTSATNICSPVCGDAYVITGKEICDDGVIGDGIGCLDDCTGSLPFFTCNTINKFSVCSSVCGDNYRTPNEECDDGDSINTNGCSNMCKET